MLKIKTLIALLILTITSATAQVLHINNATLVSDVEILGTDTLHIREIAPNCTSDLIINLDSSYYATRHNCESNDFFRIDCSKISDCKIHHNNCIQMVKFYPEEVHYLQLLLYPDEKRFLLIDAYTEDDFQTMQEFHYLTD